MSRWIVPEVVQTSAMDCGPAALKCVLSGHGVHVSYGRLREACQTDVDGTSIDVVEDVANQLGLEAEQMMLPLDHVLLDEQKALPAIMVVALPSGATHFVVVWQRHGNWVQIMDPGTGRQWFRHDSFLKQLYEHVMPVPAAAFREWAGTDAFLRPLRRRIEDIGVGAAHRWIERATADETWRELALLDAAVRLTRDLVAGGALSAGGEAERFVDAVMDRARSGDWKAAIPPSYWTATEHEADDEGEELVLLRGAVAVHLGGVRASTGEDGEEASQLSPELVAALEEDPPHPLRSFFEMLREDGFLAPGLLVLALTLSASGLLVEAMLFRGLLDLGQSLALVPQRVGAMVALVLFMCVMLALELPIARIMLRMGRKLETRLRLAFLAKIPKLNDRYFQSRLSSDMAERSHNVHTVRTLPAIATQLIRSTFTLLLTVAGITWLEPGSWPIATAVAAISILLPMAVMPLLNERDMRMRTHTGALSGFYLDALLGLVAIRAHGAERALRREHEGLLVDWSRAGLSLQSAAVGVEGLLTFAGFALSAWLLVAHIGRGGELGVVLLLVYWALSLPQHGRSIALAARQYPAHRNALMRMLEPLGAPEAKVATRNRALFQAPPSVELESVTVRAAGHLILEDVDLRIEAGSHIAIVGRSGAGKSSLVGLLLGWHRPASGHVRVDGEVLDEENVDDLRRVTAWIDPTAQLFNRSLFDNVRYGIDEEEASLGQVLEASQLRTVVERLPDGLQTRLGEGGALLSGGEGQRVRLGRGLLRKRARLVILDEPFRALERDKRTQLMQRVRSWWRDSTLLCITHDVGQTTSFDRVIVVEDGRIVEDGAPDELRKRSGGRYRALLEAEHAVRAGLWGSQAWRRLSLERGVIVDQTTAAEEKA